jgi:flagella basal body P-ring formation protein FlgA
MTVQLTEKEIDELRYRFNSIVINENITNEVIVHTLSSGKIIKGYVSESGILTVKSVSNYLCG